MPPINPTKSSTLSYWWGWNICLKAKSSLSSFAPLCALCGSVVYSRLITTRAWVMTILISIPLNASLWVHRKSACDLLRSSLVHSRLCPRGASAGGADYATLAAASIGHSEGHILYPVRPTAAKHTGQGKQIHQIAEVGRVRGSRPMGQEDHWHESWILRVRLSELRLSIAACPQRRDIQNKLNHKDREWSGRG